MTYDAESKRDPIYEQAVGLLVLSGKASTSFLQRKLGVGYEAGRKLMERAQAEGIVTQPDHVGRRAVLMRPAPMGVKEEPPAANLKSPHSFVPPPFGRGAEICCLCGEARLGVADVDHCADAQTGGRI